MKKKKIIIERVSMPGPKNYREEIIFAEEGFRVGIQFLLTRAMNRNKLSNKDLAAKLKKPIKYVNSLFAPECKIDIRELARIFFVLGEALVLNTTNDEWPFKD